MSNLKGKVAVVTGASKGIGAGIAKTLGAAGASVVVNYASSKDGAEKVVEEIKAKGGKAVAVKGDVANAADVQHIFDETRKAFGQVDVLVNNAGVYAFSPLETITEEDFHRHFNTNVLGTILATKEAAKHFGENGGSVINVSSIVSEEPVPGAAVYSATKGAVDTLTRVLAVELGPRKIRVNVIAPPLAIDGPTLTIRKFKKDKLTMKNLVEYASISPEGARVLVSAHDAFGYFGAAYGVRFEAPQGMSTESEPSAAQVAALIRQVQARAAADGRAVRPAMLAVLL